jgi:hypothetical protein
MKEEVEVERSERVEEFYTDVEEIDMGDVKFQHARPVHIKLAQQAVYFQNKVFPAASLKRERQHTERVSPFLLPKSDLTCVLLIRSGEKGDGNGRTFYVGQHAGIVEDLPRLVDEHGFKFTDIRSDFLQSDLPDYLTDEFIEQNEKQDRDDDGWRLG